MATFLDFPPSSFPPPSIAAQRFTNWEERMQSEFMNPTERSFASLVSGMRHQLAMSQEDLARELGVSFATVNRWENGHTKPSRLARAQLEAFRDKMIAGGRLVLEEQPGR